LALVRGEATDLRVAVFRALVTPLFLGDGDGDTPFFAVEAFCGVFCGVDRFLGLRVDAAGCFLLALAGELGFTGDGDGDAAATVSVAVALPRLLGDFVSSCRSSSDALTPLLRGLDWRSVPFMSDIRVSGVGYGWYLPCGRVAGDLSFNVLLGGMLTADMGSDRYGGPQYTAIDYACM